MISATKTHTASVECPVKLTIFMSIFKRFLEVLPSFLKVELNIRLRTAPGPTNNMDNDVLNPL